MTGSDVVVAFVVKTDVRRKGHLPLGIGPRGNVLQASSFRLKFLLLAGCVGFNREFAGRLVRLEILSLRTARLHPRIMWRTEAGVIAFQNEVMKYLYYRLNY